MIFALSTSIAPETQGIALAATIIPVTAHTRSLHLSLRNNSASSVNVLTGVIADHSYPAADFDFVLQAPGGRLFKLECPICEPAMIGGTLGVYWILLRPSESAAVATLPLAQFFYIDSASHWQYLCTRNNEKSLLTVSIHGRKWPTFASKPEAYWTGTASATTPIACDSKG